MTKEQHYEEARKFILKAYEYYEQGKDASEIQNCISSMTLHCCMIGDEEDVKEQMRGEDDWELAQALAFIQGFLSGSKWGYTVGVDSAELGREQNELSKRIN